MPTVAVGDGVEIHCEEQGSGPLVVLAPWWSLHPSAFDAITRELRSGHRVLRYDDRGSGLSSPEEPYDLDTAAADLTAVIEHAGEAAVIVSTADGVNRAVRVASRRPDLVEAIVCVGGAPLGRGAFAESEVLAASDGVISALLAQVETDYKGMLRSLLAATNPQFSDDELRARINAQIEHVPQHVAAERLRAWATDAPHDAALAAGGRLWVLTSEDASGGWFPAGREMAALVERELPEANVVEVSDGMVSRPDETAAVVRSILAARTVEAAD